ncbi:Fatty-acid amide hydrolase 2 [Halotydeus destructor]|nr:Fatty-acid amide hydrolase 2 [Halotydeus destructor]
MDEMDNRLNNRSFTYTVKLTLWRSLKIFLNGIIIVINFFQPAQRGRLPPLKSDLLKMSAVALSEKVRKGEISAETVIRTYIARINEVNPLINAVVDNRFAEAIKEAQLVDNQLKSGEILTDKPLLGIPFTVKDSIAVKGLIQAAGSVLRKHIIADEDAPAVAAMRNAGAIPIAVTNVPEVLLWWDSNNKLFGRTNNPYDLSRISGGSSGGEAALIASCGSLIGVCSDVGGSIRLPSQCCGTFGHKPTSRYISTKGMFPVSAEPLIDIGVFGPITRYACDLKVAMEAMATSSTSKLNLNKPVDLSQIRIIWTDNEGRNPMTSPADKEIVSSMVKAVKHFEDTYNVKAVKVDFPKLVYATDVWAAAIREKDDRDISELLFPPGYEPNITMEVLRGFCGLSKHSTNILIMAWAQKMLGVEKDTPLYHKYLGIATALKNEIHEALGDNGVLFMPTLPVAAPKHNSAVFYGTDPSYSNIVNVLQTPATHVPMGLNRQGMPIGFQILSLPRNDRLNLAVAEELEKTFGGWVCP